jgi:hypothetical protein
MTEGRALEQLSINITSDNFAQLFVIQPNTLNPGTTFPSLKSLSIVTESLTSVPQFVKSWQTPRLNFFAIEQWTPSRVWDLKDFFEALYENKRNAHPLKELKLFNGVSAELDSDEIPTVISTKGLGPLFDPNVKFPPRKLRA